MFFDWIRNPDIPVSNYCQFLRNHDWRPTTLGPMEEWDPLLRQHVCQIMLNPAPRIICWGQDLALIYNEAALKLVSVMGKHPDQLGQPTFLFWEELVRQGVRAMFDEVMIHGKAVTVVDQYFALERPSLSAQTSPAISIGSQSNDTHIGHAREGYYTFTLLPIFNANGDITGVSYEGTETTPSVVGERRLSTILSIENRSSEITSLKDVWSVVLDALDHNVQDIPFTFLYSKLDDSMAKAVTQRLSLEGSIGMSTDHPLAQLDSQNTSLATLIEQAWNSMEPMLVKCSDLKWQSEGATEPHQNDQLDPGPDVNELESIQEAKGRPSQDSPAFLRLSSHKSDSSEDCTLRQGPFIISDRGFGSPIESALILPIPHLGSSEPVAVLVTGMNPQQSYDDDYQQWVKQLTEVLTRTVASISVPEELRLQQNAIQQMAREHARVTSYLTGRKREEELAGATLRRIADMAPVGMAMFGPDGSQIWVNQGYADHVRMPREAIDIETVKTNIHPEDATFVDDAKEGKNLMLHEMRIIRGEPDPDFEPLPGDDGFDWIMAAPQVLYDHSGNVDFVFGW
jgi:hypothetical protein